MMAATSAPRAWTRAVYDVVRRIPPGRVATYALVGMLAGRPLAARAVGNAMRDCRDETVPCHRVVRSSGEPAFARHGVRLRRGGVPVIPTRVGLTPHLLRPPLRS